MATMLPEAISDQKRLVRGEQWLRAQNHLRARDGVHNKAWDFLIVAGPCPHEEINCIRAFFSKARITAIDIDENNVLAAMEAGADEAFVCDLNEMEKVDSAMLPPIELRHQEFDVICLDLTGPANDKLRAIVTCLVNQALVKRGVMMVTFSYGRDVVERLHAEWSGGDWHYNGGPRYEFYAKRAGKSYYDGDAVLCACPEGVAARVWYTLRSRTHYVETVWRYRGNRMPMVSFQFVKNHGGPYRVAAFIPVTPEDLPFALIDEQLNLSMIYATPLERIEAFRRNAVRKEAARKAVETKRARKRLPKPVPLLTFQERNGDGSEQHN